MSSASRAPATRSIIYLGMDVHKESITIAVLPADAKVPKRPQIAAVAVARELVGFPWSVMQDVATPELKAA